MGQYLVTCAEREDCPAGGSPAHIRKIRLKGPEGERVLKVAAARLMLSAGDVLTLGEATDADAELRKTRCDTCGAPTLRTRRKDNPSDLQALPNC